MKQLVLILGIALCMPVFAQSTSLTATPKATATLSSSCVISAQNVSFGQLSLPVGSQSAGSNMSVLCTQGSNYTINLAYGGVYGQGSVSGTLNYVRYNNGCIYGGYINGTYYSQSVNAQNCDPTYTYRLSPYSYGVLKGASKGDSVGYSIQVPNSPGKVWNNGVNSYSAVATGQNDSLPILATLQAGQGSSYPAPDSYSDTITATISY